MVNEYNEIMEGINQVKMIEKIVNGNYDQCESSDLQHHPISIQLIVDVHSVQLFIYACIRMVWSYIYSKTCLNRIPLGLKNSRRFLA